MLCINPTLPPEFPLPRLLRQKPHAMLAGASRVPASLLQLPLPGSGTPTRGCDLWFGTTTLNPAAGDKNLTYHLLSKKQRVFSLTQI